MKKLLFTLALLAGIPYCYGLASEKSNYMGTVSEQYTVPVDEITKYIHEHKANQALEKIREIAFEYENNINLNGKNSSGQTILTEALIQTTGRGLGVKLQDFVDLVASLIRGGAIATPQDFLMLFSNIENLDKKEYKATMSLAKKLLAKKVDPNKGGLDNKTALMFAAEYGYPELVRLLLDNGANPALRSNSGATALSLAIVGRNELISGSKKNRGNHKQREKIQHYDTVIKLLNN